MSAPKLRIAASDNRSKSSPITALFATLKPPSVCREPSVVEVASVVSSLFRIPLKVPVVPARAAKEPAATLPEPITVPSIAPPSMLTLSECNEAN